MKNNYTVIAYKPDSEDYCRGCRMASYSSDLCIHNRLTRKEAIDTYKNYLVKAYDLRVGEAGYSITIICDSFIFFSDAESGCIPDEWEDEEFEFDRNEYNEFNKEFYSAKKDVEQEIVNYKEEKRRKEIEQQQQKNRVEKEAKDKYERETYERLSKKFGTPTS